MTSQRSILTKIRHTGIVVRDMNTALTFYEGLGCELYSRELETGPFIDVVVGIDQVKVETAKLRVGEQSVVELLQYHSHPDNKPIEKAKSNRLGCSHIAFTVTDIESACERIRQLGGSIVNEPKCNVAGTVRVAYAHDLEGVLLEIVEEL